ncbi:MAG: nickel-type superoxide dismutase maturation protease [Pyrinomonadaceae bacterium]
MSELPDAGLFEIALLLFDYRMRYRVEGGSMLPLLREGDQLVVDKNAPVEVGDVIIARHPFIKGLEMVKRVARIDERGNYFLLGDNPAESTDSRTFGAVPIECIKGKVVSRLR